MTYKEALDFISTAAAPGSVYGLERIRALLDALGNPQDSLRFIHIAGTNGKGSVSRMLACVLTAAGYRVGCFNSPCLVSPCEYLSVSDPIPSDHIESSRETPNNNTWGENICTDGKDNALAHNYNPVAATEEEFVEEVERVRAATAVLDTVDASQDCSSALRPTAFEYYTAMAIDFFARRSCDFAILECGLGGKDDSTNVIPSPEVAIITRIGLDHTELLGPDIASIAAAKAGIIKKGCSVIAYPSDEEALNVIRETCVKEACSISVADPAKLRIVHTGILEGDSVTYDGSPKLRLSLMGAHQALNAAVVIEAVKALNDRIMISDEALRRGLAGTVWPARLTLMSTDPPVILDGAHNPQCMSALCQSLEYILSNMTSQDEHSSDLQTSDSDLDNTQICQGNSLKRKFLVITGVMADKDYKDMYRTLAPYAGKVIAVRPDNPRSLEPAEIVRIFEGYGVPGVVSDSVVEALKQAKKEVIASQDKKEPGAHTPEPLAGVVVTGSLYMMKPLLEQQDLS
ncbi:MAG: bifunctional folylpolyglutamate synthase/dihydrofolate synthase [Lachnospiraceae bacterium]|nr:bifunctional folylpolyglutamate synthase/dihydrofolate synthase [Lachnospiraceae bacterium]